MISPFFIFYHPYKFLNRSKHQLNIVSNKLLEKVGKKIILLGNEAVVRGALESGVQFSSTYPGTPASEIGDTFAEIAREAGIYFEYSANEKVAFEAAAGASFSGLRSIVSFKQFGLNVASDSILPVAYTGVRGGLVIVVSDDPGCWSSAQSEQDSRWYARLAHIPMLEPSDAQECKNFTKLAFELSEKFDLPIFLRLTTRVSHMKSVVKTGRIVRRKKVGNFVKDLEKFDSLPPHTMEMHEAVLKKNERLGEYLESKINFIVDENAKSNFGIIVSGVAFNYVMDALDDMKIEIPILKVGLTYPLPKKKISEFIKKFKSVLVVEEIEPIIEDEIKILAKDVNPTLKIFGKEEYLPKSGELTEEKVVSAITRITGKKYGIVDLKKHLKNYKKIKIAKRFPLMCPGCPHRAIFFAAKTAAGTDTIFGGDIGCYILGIFPPLETQDFIFSMGAVQGVSHGIKKVSNQKTIAFIGDSTFFHAGMPGLVNMVYNKSNPLVIVLDNRTTAMTGHQPHPGVGVTAMGESSKPILIEDVARAFGVKNVKVVDPFNLKETADAVREFINKNEVSVIVAKRECELLAVRRKKREGIKIPKFEIDQKKCDKCGVCLYKFACPAFKREGKRFEIDRNLCTGCAVCVQVCPVRAIVPVKG